MQQPEQLRVAFVTAMYPMTPGKVCGGVEGYCQNLVAELRKLPDVRLEVILLLAERYGVTAYTRMDLNGLTVHAVPSGSRLPMSARVWTQRVAPALRLAGGGPFDLIHVQALPFWAVRPPVPAVLTVHGIEERDASFRHGKLWNQFQGRIYGALMRQVRARVPNIIAINPYVRTLLGTRPGQRFWDVENAVSDRFFAIERNPQPGRVLSSGHLCVRKNTLGLIEAFGVAAQGHPDWQLRLTGFELEPDYSRECRAAAARLGVADRVHFLGVVDEADLRDELARASVLALCSKNETAPLIISEAMCAGLPVLGSAVCGIPYMIKDGETGRLADPHDRDAIAAALGRMLSSDDLVAMGRRTRQSAESRFRASAVARRTAEVYREILASA